MCGLIFAEKTVSDEVGLRDRGFGLGALGVRLSTAHAGPGSSEAHPAGRMIGIGLRAREP